MQNSSLTTAQRLGLGFGVVIAFLVLCIGFAYRALTTSNDSLKTIYEDRTVALQQLGEIRYLIARNRIIFLDAEAARDPAVTTRRVAEYEKNSRTAEKTWKAYSATYMTPEEKSLASDMDSLWAGYRNQAEGPAFAALRAQDYERATVGLQAISKMSPRVQAAVDALTELQVRIAESTYQEAASSNKRTLQMLLGLGLLALLTSVAAAIFIVRKIVGTLGAEPQELAHEADRIAQGDLSRSNLRAVAPGSVMANMQTMRGRLQEVVGLVRQSAESVASASSQIAHGTNNLSARTEEQASSLEETAASMEQMAVTVRQTTDGANGAYDMTARSTHIAEQGGESVGRMVETMREIQESSQKISDIIGVIDSIAFQTNILALNAAVEAARAGEQGRGFAVVASEVRALASRSANAAKEIKTLIQTSTERVKQGGMLAASTGETINNVVLSIREVSQLMGQMRHSATEQDAGIRQVNEAIGQIDQTMQQNAALVEEMAAASEHLRSQSESLVAAVAVFQLDKAPSPPISAAQIRRSPHGQLSFNAV